MLVKWTAALGSSKPVSFLSVAGGLKFGYAGTFKSGGTPQLKGGRKQDKSTAVVPPAAHGHRGWRDTLSPLGPRGEKVVNSSQAVALSAIFKVNLRPESRTPVNLLHETSPRHL